MQTASIFETRSSEDDDYQRLLLHLHNAPLSGPMFTTDASAPFDTFLAMLPADRRQHYTCRACRRFVERFGSLVTVDAAGVAQSPFWSNFSAPLFGYAAVAVRDIVSRARITGVFLSEETAWGVASNTAKNGPRKGITWSHMHAVPPLAIVYRPSVLKSTASAMAEKHEDYGMLSRGLAEFPLAVVQQAHTLLTTGGLYRSEKCIGVAKWLLDLHEAREATKNARLRENLVWRAVALAPPGYAHVRSTMISTLLEDIAAGKAFEDIKRSFDAKMSPIQYLRPQAAPTDGQLAAAEAAVSKLASAGSLARRFATFDDVKAHAIWLPTVATEAPKDGVFGHLKASKSSVTIDVSTQAITWEKFARTVLPNAERIEYLTPRVTGPFFAFVTAENLDAPPMLQWDHESERNPVSGYVYYFGSPPTQWGLTAGAFVEVTAIMLGPQSWGSVKMAHQGESAHFILRGAVDSNLSGGLGLFPEILRSEYHGIRAAIEAYSRAGQLSGRENASACGVVVSKSGGGFRSEFRVTVKGARAHYVIDRWD